MWIFALLVWVSILAVQETRLVFMEITGEHPYIGGFVKFFFLASMGDLLGIRIRNGEWVIPGCFIYKAFVWGLFGMAITLLFPVYMGGVSAAQQSGYLPFAGSIIAQAFFGSVIMNVTFGPMLYVYHKFSELLIDSGYEEPKEKIMVSDLVDRVDWHTMVSFSWLINCVFIWIPCHTLVFILPSEYRVLASAFLSILLGVLVSFAKKKKISYREKA